MNLLFRSLLRFIIYGILMFLCSYIIQQDFINGTANEDGLIEFYQHIVLLICVLIGVLSIIISKQYRIFMALLSQFILIHLIREFDAWFDHQFPALGWFPFVVVILVVMLIIIIKSFKTFIEEFNHFRSTMGFGILLFALAKLHVFTRIYGTPSNWKSIMGENYMYQVERISEESVELVAYTMILIAMSELFMYARKEIKS